VMGQTTVIIKSTTVRPGKAAQLQYQIMPCHISGHHRLNH
jgi:hypothetical protein